MLVIKQWIIKQGNELGLTTDTRGRNSNKLFRINSFFTAQSTLSHNSNRPCFYTRLTLSFFQNEKRLTPHLYFLSFHAFSTISKRYRPSSIIN